MTHERPELWWRLLVDAVIAFRRKRYAAVDTYVSFVREHRGDAVADGVMRNVARLARAEGWANCERWPAWNYRSRDPNPPREKRKSGARYDRATQTVIE